MVVEDDDLIRQTVTHLLEDEGYRVIGAVNGRAALAALRVERPAVILLDMRMPVLDGWGFMQEYRAWSDRVPVVVMSAAHNVQVWCDEVGADDCIPKPFDIAEVLSVVERHIHAS